MHSSVNVLFVSDSIGVTTMEQLLHNVCLLLSSRTREVVKAALGFMKVTLFIMEPKKLAAHVAVMVFDLLRTKNLNEHTSLM